MIYLVTKFSTSLLYPAYLRQVCLQPDDAQFTEAMISIVQHKPILIFHYNNKILCGKTTRF